MDPLKVPQQQEAKLHFLDYWRIIRIRKTVILAVFLLVVITATLVTFILPESFSSTARVRIDRDVTDIESVQTARSPLGYDPYFIQTEFEVMQSEMVLKRVVELENLNVLWGKKFAGGETLKTSVSISFLKKRMNVRSVRNTSLIEIEVFSEDKDEASKLANAIAKTYQDHRSSLRTRLTEGGIKVLEQRYQEQSEKVASSQKELENLRQSLDISDIDAQGTAPTPSLESDTLRRFLAQVTERSALVTELEVQISKLKALSRDELRQVLPRIQQDVSLTELLSQLNMAEQRLVVLRKDYATEHPDVLRTQAQVDDLEKKIEKSIDGIMTALNNRADSAKAGVAKLQELVDDAKKQDIEKARKSRPYFDKKRELEQLYRFESILHSKLMAERIDLTIPRTAMVEIVDYAEPGQQPVRPNKPLNIALGIIIGLVVGVGLAFFIEYLDTSVKTIDDVERTLQSPVLGVIPQNVGYLFEEGSESPHAEAYRVLRTNLLFSRKDDKLNSVAVVSAGAGEGKSTTVMNLATTFAQSGQRVVVVDSDLRRPTLHKMLGISNNLGLTNYLLKQNTLEEVIQTTNVPTLDFLASGKLPSSSMGILSSGPMKELINDLKQRYDFVFFDSPPIMGVSDASILASEVDVTLQVIQYRRYPQPMNIRAKQLIEKVGGNLVGIVLNNINMSQDESYYYYSGYYHDYYSKNEEMEPAPSSGKPGDGKDKVEIKQKY